MFSWLLQKKPIGVETKAMAFTVESSLCVGSMFLGYPYPWIHVHMECLTNYTCDKLSWIVTQQTNYGKYIPMNQWKFDNPKNFGPHK